MYTLNTLQRKTVTPFLHGPKSDTAHRHRCQGMRFARTTIESENNAVEIDDLHYYIPSAREGGGCTPQQSVSFDIIFYVIHQ